MNATSLPPAPTDGSHPHAQPVHYARPNAYTTTASAWQEEFRLLLLEVAHSPILRREIDRGAPAEDSTFATRREFEDVMRAQEALQQARRAGKKIVAQNTRPLEKPGTAPSQKRAKSYEPTGNPRGRPKGSTKAVGKSGEDTAKSRRGMFGNAECPVCLKSFPKNAAHAVYCSESCKRKLNKARQRGAEVFVPSVAVCRCGKEFTTRSHHNVTCSAKCSKARLSAMRRKTGKEAAPLPIPHRGQRQ